MYLQYIGIDEVGRGPLAGPVVVAGVKVKKKHLRTRMFYAIRDSKRLTLKQKEWWFSYLTKHPRIKWAVARIYPKTIDRINISRAANLAAQRVYKKLEENKQSFAFLDGGLLLQKNIPHQTIIKGDEKIQIIAAASIIAKVLRDRYMTRLHKRYPLYDFASHKGYGTKKHIITLKKFGSSEVHRKSFLSFLS